MSVSQVSIDTTIEHLSDALEHVEDAYNSTVDLGRWEGDVDVHIRAIRQQLEAAIDFISDNVAVDDDDEDELS